MAPLLALVAVVGVPVLVACNPPWLRRWTLPMLAVTSIGVYATVPDTEHVIVVMIVVVVAAIIAFSTSTELPSIAAAAIALVMVVAALADSAGEPAPIARAIGCFAGLLAVPVASAFATRRQQGRPPLLVVLIAHGAVAVLASRALIRSESAVLVIVAIGLLLLVHVAVLVGVSRQ